MREGLTVDEAESVILAATVRLGSETISVANAEGRVLAEPIAFESYADTSFVRPLEELDWGIERLPAEGGVYALEERP